jgi:leukotriene-A4 hydrolase
MHGNNKIDTYIDEKNNNKNINFDIIILKNLFTYFFIIRFNKPGMPPVEPDFDTTLIESSTKLANELITQSDLSNIHVDISKWESAQIVVLLEKILEAQSTSTDKIAFGSILNRINDKYHFLQSKNAEIRFRFLTACIRSDIETAHDAVVQFLIEQGRMKVIKKIHYINIIDLKYCFIIFYVFYNNSVI